MPRKSCKVLYEFISKDWYVDFVFFYSSYV